MKKIWFSLIGILLMFSAKSIQFTEGQQYVQLQNPLINGPQVIEFFSFYCPHCYQFEHIYNISRTIKKVLPSGTKIVKYHVNFLGPMGKQLTQAWATAMVLGIEDKVSLLLFNGLQKTQTIKTSEDIRAVFIKVGISTKEYDSVLNSPIVKSLVIQQEKTAFDLQLRSVPAICVNGKYMIKNNGLDMLSIIDYRKQFVDVVKFLLSKK